VPLGHELHSLIDEVGLCVAIGDTLSSHFGEDLQVVYCAICFIILSRSLSVPVYLQYVATQPCLGQGLYFLAFTNNLSKDLLISLHPGFLCILDCFVSPTLHLQDAAMELRLGQGPLHFFHFIHVHDHNAE